MRRGRRSETETVWAPLADVMTLLASVFFVVMVAMFVATQRAHEAERARTETQRAKGARLERAEKLIAEAQRQLDALRDIGGGVTVEDGIVRLPDTVLFGINSDELKPEGRALLEGKVAPVLDRLGTKGPRIIVSGHADARQIWSSPFGNWSLSARRASKVVEILLSRTRLPQDRLVAVGYGDTRPRPGLDPTDGANRRVELSVSIEVADILGPPTP